MAEGRYPAAAEKAIRDAATNLERDSFNSSHFSEHLLFSSELAYEE